MGLQNFETLMFTWVDSGEYLYSYQVLELPLAPTSEGLTNINA